MSKTTKPIFLGSHARQAQQQYTRAEYLTKIVSQNKSTYLHADNSAVAELIGRWLFLPSIEIGGSGTMNYKSIRFGVISSLLGALLSMGLLSIGNKLGLVVLLYTGSLIGLSLIGLWMETKKEVISIRVLIASTLGAFGVGTAGLFTLLLK